MGNRMNDSAALTRGTRTNTRARASLESLLEAIIQPEPWVQDALCAQTDPEAFFPEKGGSTRDAKRICNGAPGAVGCEVREQCLRYSLERDERFGIWGGLSERERRKLRRAGRAS
jgi:WhiB family redox-sensing transcriptional regulator